jgi:hypothetical protein
MVLHTLPKLNPLMDDATFLKRFEACQFSPDQWHHREHIRAAYLYLRRYPFKRALQRIRQGIQALNASQHVPESRTRGYHETMTQAWLSLVFLILREYGPEKTAEKFYQEHPELGQKRALRFFYSQKQLMSARAKAVFVKPDLAPLPKPRARRARAGSAE